MYRELITGFDSAGPASTICVEANLISLGRVNALKADLRRADSKRIAINNPRHTR